MNGGMLALQTWPYSTHHYLNKQKKPEIKMSLKTNLIVITLFIFPFVAHATERKLLVGYSGNNPVIATFPAMARPDILDFSKEDQTLRFKKINTGGNWPHAEDTELSYIVQFSHPSYSDFNVCILFLDIDGFEITRSFLGACQGASPLDPSAQYNLKRTFWAPQKSVLEYVVQN